MDATTALARLEAAGTRQNQKVSRPHGALAGWDLHRRRALHDPHLGAAHGAG